MKKITAQEEKLVAKLYTNTLGAQEIALKLNLSLSQVYDSLIRQKITRRTAREQNKIRFLKSPLSFKFPKKLRNNQSILTNAALMLYKGEGAKTGTTVDFANSDIGSLKVFLAFLRRVCQINENRLKLYLYCFSNQNPTTLIKFWSKELKVNTNNFTKPYIRKTKQNLTRTMSNGVLHIRYSDKRLLELILESSERLIQKII